MTFRSLSFFAAALLSAALCAPLLGPLAVAQENSLYTVSNVHVDATGASSTEALNAAIAQGRARAFQMVYRRLTRQAGWTPPPVLDTPGLFRISRGYNSATKRRATTRYFADVTYMFNPEGVARLLRSAQIAFSQTQARRVLVIPMSPGVGHGPWSQALMSPAFRDSQVPFTVLAPEDDAALAGLNMDAGWNDVAAGAAENHVSEVALGQGGFVHRQMKGKIPPVG